MPAQLVFRSPEGEQRVTLERPLVVGRDAACDVSIASVRLSRRHAEFSIGPDGVAVRDLGSKNGILVNGTSVDQAVLKPGDRVLLGDVSVSVSARESPVPAIGPLPAERTAPVPAPVPGAPIDPDKTSRLPSGAVPAALPPPPAEPAAPVPPPAAVPVASVADRIRSRFGLHARVVALGAAAGLLTYLASTCPGSVVAGQASAREAEARAATVIRLLAAENRTPLLSGEPLAVTVHPAMQEPGVRAAMVIAPEGRVLAPAERLNTTVNSLAGLGAVDAIGDVTVARVGGEVHAACAVEAAGRRLGVAWIAFDPAYASDNRRMLLLVRLASLAAALAIGLGTAAVSWHMLAGRLTAFAKDLDLTVAGRQGQLAERYGIPALARSIEAINFLVERRPPVTPAVQMPPVPAGAPAPGPGHHETAASGTVTLDSSFMVRAADAGVAGLLGGTPEALIGRHVLEAANRAVVDLIIDCLGDLGSAPSATRESPVARVTASRSAPAGPVTLTLEARRGG